MALIPQTQRLSDFTNLIAEMNTFLTGVAGWTIDKYVVDTELYVHTTATGDATEAHYSMHLVAIDAYTQYLVVYPNTGFNTGQTVDNQPGTPKNTAGTLSYAIEHGTALSWREGWIVANENFFMLCCMTQEKDTLWEFDHVYCGNITKDFAFTGGQYIAGNQVYEPSSPPSAMYYDGGVGAWYTEDGGTFADVGGKALSPNHINYDASSVYGFSHYNTSIHYYPRVMFVEHNGGFAPVGSPSLIWDWSGTYEPNIPAGRIKLGNVSYLTLPYSTMGGEYLVIEDGTY